MQSAAPFASSFEHLLVELDWIDLVVRAQVSRVQKARGEAGAERAWADAIVPNKAADQTTLDRLRAEIDAREMESLRQGVPHRLSMLVDAFELSRFDVDVLLIGLLPEIDSGFERLFAYLNNDPLQKHPSIDMALGLLCSSQAERLAARRRFAAEASLLRHGLIHVFTDPPRQHPPLLACSFKIDDRIVEYLHGSDAIDRRLLPCARVEVPERAIESLLLHGELRDRLSRLVKDPEIIAGPGQVVYLQGPYGVGKKTTALALCHALGKRLLVVDGVSLGAASQEVVDAAARSAARETLLLDAALYWQGFDLLLGDDKRAQRAAVLSVLADLQGLSFLAGEAPFEPDAALRGRRALRIEIGLPSLADQARLWAGALGEDVRLAPEVDMALLASRYRLSGGQIRDAANAARDLSRFRDPERGAVTLSDLSLACRLSAERKLSTLARRLDAHRTWEDLVLPKDRLERLREICNHARYRGQVWGAWGFDRKLDTGKGLNLLFTGPPGTGKTMTARVMAGELGLDLYQIDLSSVVSKYIGETEKQLARVFAEAEQSHAILFFDEADALFGKRTEVRDAHDRYANLETSYLLQRMEAYEGVAILATNFSRNIDEAFTRRIQFIIEFSLPNERERLSLWERIWPEGVPRAPGLDLGFMARRFELSGGHIRNIAVAAAFLAAAEGGAVTQRHLLHATRREYQKMGKVAEDAMFVYRP